MERSTIYYLHQKGWTNTQIAAFVGHHRNTIARVLREPLNQQPARRVRRSNIAIFDHHIETWLDQGLTVQRMIELARADPTHPYQGSAVAFYNYVRPKRLARRALPADVTVRFEGLPGEFLQIDWGEVRNLALTHPQIGRQTRYFFAARLKYSRWMFVRFTTTMRAETLLRCLIACFGELGGVPWVVTSDNMRTIVLGRDAHNQPLWHPAYQQFATEFGFHPTVCTPGAANQKGAVENLVKFVKQNFLAGRRFYDDDDLAAACTTWLQQVNTRRPSRATGDPPQHRLREEVAAFKPLPPVADDYGFVESVLVNRESVVTIETNRYSVPTTLVGIALTARLHATRIDLFQGTTLVATHARHQGRHTRIIEPTHYEALFARKPRARVLLYREWLVALGPVVATYLQWLGHKRYAELDDHVCALYQLAQQVGRDAFVTAVDHATTQQAIGVEYVRACLTTRPPVAAVPPQGPREGSLPHLGHLPTQPEVERDLGWYERYVANTARREEHGHDACR